MSLNQGQIKWIATILMVIDHTGFLLDLEPMQIIGRLSFPLFSWIFAQNWKRRREDTAKPLIDRLIIFGIIAQFPYILFNSANFQLNTLFSFALVTILFNQVHQEKNHKILTLVIGLIVAEILNVDYGWYAVICSLIMIDFKPRDRRWWVGWIVVNIAYSLSCSSFIQLFAIFTPIILSYHNLAGDQKPTIFEKKFFYYFYPVHLAGLAALRTIL